MKQLTTAWTRTGKTMALLAFAQSSFNITLCDDPVVFPSGHAERWAGRETVALFSFGYQNIFATSLSFDSGKIAFKWVIRFYV